MEHPFKMKLSKDDVRACGRVVVWSAMLEATLDAAIWALSGSPKRTAAFRKKMRNKKAETKQAELLKLSETTNLQAAQRDRLRQIVLASESAIKNRNVVVHALWYLGHDGAMWARKYDKDGAASDWRLDGPAIHKVAEDNKQLAIALAHWNNEFKPGVMPASFPPVDD